MTIPNYEFLTEATVPAYIAGRPGLASLVDASALDVREVGDGNLNLVFVCQDPNGHGVVLKQSLPYVRAAGEGWPLTPERGLAEARGLAAGAAASPETSARLYEVDRDRFIIAMEDLSELTIWRTKLNDGDAMAPAAELCGRHVARLLAHTGLMDLDPQTFRAERALLPNAALCDITEQLVFTEPYIDHDHNGWPAAVDPLVAEIRADDGLRAAVGRLKQTFMTVSDCLIHGDLHTGSVMVGEADGDVRAVVMDPEFCFYGPVAFDLGALFGNYLAACVRAAMLGQDAHREEVAGLSGATWRGFEHELRRRWLGRRSGELDDRVLEPWLRDIRMQAIGFGACKAIRRMLGFAKVTDIETLPADVHADGVELVLTTARAWLADVHDIQPSDLMKDVSR